MPDPAEPSVVVEAGGASIPTLGLGTWSNTGRQCVETVRTALELGYRHIDTAQAYGNERAVGRGIAEADIDRADVFVTTKVSRSKLRYEDVLDSVESSLNRLNIGYIDLLLIHWPHPRRPFEETLDAMAALQDDGVVRHLGVANFTRKQLRKARRSSSSPLVTDQVLYHPLKDQSNLIEYCRDHDMSITAYSPLARGAIVGDTVLERIGQRYDKTAVQVALRWLIQQDGVVAIPKATGRAHLEENIDVFDFELSGDEMARISDRKPGPVLRLKNAAPGLMRRIPF